MAIITLTTDFGIADEYVGVMKGVILGIHPEAAIVDITHHILPQDLYHAAYTIKSSYAYFPTGTVHIIVVDPGVGSPRSIIGLEKQGHFFLAPDNGVLSLLYDDVDTSSFVQVNNSRYFLKSVSRTFHGRDIFAPVGAHLSLGARLADVGDAIERSQLVYLDMVEPVRSGNEITGHIISIDRFGNLISNIGEQLFADSCRENNYQGIEIRLGKIKIRGLSQSYASRSGGKPLAIIGSRGTIEIAVNKGSAQKTIKAEKGNRITVKICN